MSETPVSPASIDEEANLPHSPAAFEALQADPSVELIVVVNTNPLGGIYLPLIGEELTARAKFRVTKEEAAGLLKQIGNYAVEDAATLEAVQAVADAQLPHTADLSGQTPPVEPESAPVVSGDPGPAVPPPPAPAGDPSAPTPAAATTPAPSSTPATPATPAMPASSGDQWSDPASAPAATGSSDDSTTTTPTPGA